MLGFRQSYVSPRSAGHRESLSLGIGGTGFPGSMNDANSREKPEHGPEGECEAPEDGLCMAVMNPPCVTGFVGEPAASAPLEHSAARPTRARRDVQAPLRSCTQSESW